MRRAFLFLVFGAVCSLSALSAAGEGVVEFVEVKPDPRLAPANTAARVYYRVPSGYDPAAKMLCRVLVYFGGKNCSGEAEAKSSGKAIPTSIITLP